MEVILSSFYNEYTFMFIHQCDSVEKWIIHWTSSDIYVCIITKITVQILYDFLIFILLNIYKYIFHYV